MKNNQPDVKYVFRKVCAFMDCAEVCEREASHIRLRTASHFLADITKPSLACEI